MLVGDVDAFGAALEAAGLGPIVIERDDDGRPAAGPPADDAAAAGPTDDEGEAGPTAGAEEPDLPGTADEPVPAPGGGDAASEER